MKTAAEKLLAALKEHDTAINGIPAFLQEAAEGLESAMESPSLIVRLCADNDRNGNPRRCFVAIDAAGEIVGVEDEGYHGDAYARKRWPGIPIGPSFKVVPKDYHQTIRLGKALEKTEVV